MNIRTKILFYIIYYFYRVYGRPLDGRKKLQKLVFLVEHLDTKNNKIEKSSGITGYKFKVWSYGPFSGEIYDDLKKLEREGLIKENVETWSNTPTLYSYIDDGVPRIMFKYEPQINKDVNLPTGIKKKIERIVVEFGGLKPMILEHLVNKMLGLTPEKKVRYWGITIDEYIERLKNPDS